MKQFDDMLAWQDFRRGLDSDIGFVPTMGALHAGHRSLVEASVADSARTVVSLFVNPTQFDNDVDLAAYPVALEQDLALLERWGANDVLMPGYVQLYADDYRYRLSERGLSSRFCGAHRPGHFDGVLTVVMKLFNLVRPARAYFGEKDYQQMLLIRGMAEAFFMDLEIVACPTVRAPDGLALSSRNLRLDAKQRELAPELQRCLRRSDDCAAARRYLEQLGFEVDYVEDFNGRRLAAAVLGDVRLIDNVPIGESHER